MNTLAGLGVLAPNITKLVRRDHTQVLMTAHRYSVRSSPARKQAIVRWVCNALAVHTRLEEEIFYPALRAAGAVGHVLDRTGAEHDDMLGLIAELRGMEPTDGGYDERFMGLLRTMLHHVADEETVLLPAAERLLEGRLGELGARWLARRMQLRAPRPALALVRGAQAKPMVALLTAGGLLAGGLLASGWLWARSNPARWR
jgi:hypothetical protein